MRIIAIVQFQVGFGLGWLYEHSLLTVLIQLEFRGQLETTMSLMVGVAYSVMAGVKKRKMKEWETEREQLKVAHKSVLQELTAKKVFGICYTSKMSCHKIDDDEGLS